MENAVELLREIGKCAYIAGVSAKYGKMDLARKTWGRGLKLEEKYRTIPLLIRRKAVKLYVAEKAR